MVPEPCIFSLTLPCFPLLSQCLYLLNSEPCGYFIFGLGSCRHNEDYSESCQGTFLNNSIIFVRGILSPSCKTIKLEAHYKHLLVEWGTLIISEPQSFVSPCVQGSVGHQLQNTALPLGPDCQLTHHHRPCHQAPQGGVSAFQPVHQVQSTLLYSPSLMPQLSNSTSFFYPDPMSLSSQAAHYLYPSRIGILISQKHPFCSCFSRSQNRMIYILS